MSRQLSTGSAHSLVPLSLFEILCDRGWAGWHLWGSDPVREPGSAQGSQHLWHQLGAECVGGSSAMTNLGCGCRALTEHQHWFTCCCFSPFWVRLCAASCPTQPARLCSAASLPGHHTQHRCHQQKHQWQLPPDRQWQTCAGPSVLTLSPPFHAPSKSDEDTVLWHPCSTETTEQAKKLLTLQECAELGSEFAKDCLRRQNHPPGAIWREHSIKHCF